MEVNSDDPSPPVIPGAESSADDTPLPAIYDSETLFGSYVTDGDGKDGHVTDGTLPLHIARNARRGLEREAEVTERLEKLKTEQRQAIEQISRMLRAILAERMVSGGAEELDATDAERAARKMIYGTSSIPDKDWSRDRG